MAHESHPAELVLRARSGDRDALTALFALYGARILRTVELRMEPGPGSRS